MRKMAAPTPSPRPQRPASQRALSRPSPLEVDPRGQVGLYDALRGPMSTTYASWSDSSVPSSRSAGTCWVFELGHSRRTATRSMVFSQIKRWSDCAVGAHRSSSLRASTIMARPSLLSAISLPSRLWFQSPSQTRSCLGRFFSSTSSVERVFSAVFVPSHGHADPQVLQGRTELTNVVLLR